MPDFSTVVATQVTQAVTLNTVQQVVQVNSSVPGSYDTVARLGLGMYHVREYGAIADGGYEDDLAITSGLTALTSASNPWTVADVGKSIRVIGAGTAGAALETTISAYVSAGQVTLGSAASTSVTGAWGVWGTDNLSAFNATVTAIPDPSPGDTGYGAAILLDSAKTYYLSSGWTITKNVVLVGNGANVGGTITLGSSNSFPCSARDLTVVAASSQGFVYTRVQGGQFSGLRAVGCGGVGHQVGGNGSSCNYGQFYGLYANENISHGLYLAGGTDNVNANHFFGPVCRSNGGFGIYIVATDGADYNDFFAPQIEGNALGSVEGGAANDCTFFGGHYVDNDGASTPLVIEFTGSRNRLFGGRIIGATTALSGVSYSKTTFSSGGLRSEPEYRAASITFTDSRTWTTSGSSPEGSVTAVIGSLHSRTGGTTGLYFKESGSGDTGWRLVTMT